MNAEELIAKISKLNKSEYEPEAIASMDAWVRQLQNVLALETLASNQILKDVLDDLRLEVERIDDILVDRKKVVELLNGRQVELLSLYDKKDIYLDFIRRFTSDSPVVEEIANAVSSIE
jgi:hypothetical protein